jgi:hypothetical protein
MEKVKLTPKQAETFEKIIEIVNQDQSLWPLLPKILKNGYEIEEQFKTGDLVVLLGDICEIIRFQCDTPMKDDGRCYFTLKRLSDGIEFYNIPREHVRLATNEEITAEKERRKWAEIGRKVNEYRKGDLVKHNYYEFDEVELINPEAVYLKRLKSFYALNEIELICPVELRFDMKDDTE